jgi:hypothetical protein
MPLPNRRNGQDNNRILYQYAGMASQFLVAIGAAVFAGYQIDHWLDWGVPVWIWVLPLLVITGMIYGVIRNSTKK